MKSLLSLGSALLVLLCLGSSTVHSLKQYYDICDQVTLLGYPCQHELAVTSDGFELDVIHLPQPSGNGSSNSSKGYPVVLQHGLLDSAITFVANAHPYQNLGCLLWDQGYDVFMPNSRGNHYSLGNDQYSSSEPEYWRRIDMDGMAKHDVPAVIQLVLSRTGSPTLTWVGHSQGTWQAFTAFGNLHRELAKKVDLYVALAPVAHVGHSTSFLLHILADVDVGQWLGIFGFKSFLENDWFLRQVSKLCTKLGELCPSVLELLVGDGNPANTNVTQLPIIVRYDPGGTSVNNMIHWSQEVKSGNYQAHNYGLLENLKLYGDAFAPKYKLDTMTAPPTALFSGGRDALADPQDVAIIVKELPNATLVQHTVIQDFAHLDFVWGLDAAKLLYNPYVLPLIAKYKGSAQKP